MSFKASFKGMLGELKVNLTSWLALDKAIYYRINNVTLPLENGGSTQIDHVIVSKFGIFVIETKNYKGWIFGSERQAQWTQRFGSGVQFKFQNPLHQNYGHIKTLERLLNLPANNFYSMIIFVGECELKTKNELPDNVMTNGWVSYVRSKKPILLSGIQVNDIIQTIKSGRLKKSSKTNKQHKKYVQEKHKKVQDTPIISNSTVSNQTTPSQNVEKETAEPNCPKCPKCHSKMIKRVAKQGKNIGNEFWGCSQYPKCKGNISC